MLEKKLHPFSCVIGLSYDDKFLPRSEDGRGILVPKQLQDWLKRFRAAYSPNKIRFYACGEYGDESWRPHFHCVVFNYPNCLYGESRYQKYRVKDCCVHCDFIRDTWGKGLVHLMELNDHTAQYCAQYVTKKLTDVGHPALKGLPPEFARMSQGIGKLAMWEVASTLLEFNLVDTQDDVPSSLRHGTRLLPLGRYLRKELRKMVGRDEKAPEASLQAIEEELRPLRESAFEGSRSFKKEIVQAADQAVKNMEVKHKIFRQRKDKL